MSVMAIPWSPSSCMVLRHKVSTTDWRHLYVRKLRSGRFCAVWNLKIGSMVNCRGGRRRFQRGTPQLDVEENRNMGRDPHWSNRNGRKGRIQWADGEDKLLPQLMMELMKNGIL